MQPSLVKSTCRKVVYTQLRRRGFIIYAFVANFACLSVVTLKRRFGRATVAACGLARSPAKSPLMNVPQASNDVDDDDDDDDILP